jgi:hypothetical protein
LKKITYLVALTLFLSSCDWFNTKPEIASVLDNHFDEHLVDILEAKCDHMILVDGGANKIY